jgi:KipI family sensor histidine kinase inhibitor
MRFLPAGPTALLVELNDPAAVMPLYEALRDDPVPGVADIIPAAQTLLVQMRPGLPADRALASQIVRRLGRATAPERKDAAPIEIPVVYDGPDLAEVAEHMQITPDQVVAAHQSANWQVAFCGFAPGFAYLICDDPRFDLPRRAAPRVKVPAGSVGLAGRFGGIYPHEGPGGWQIIGSTSVAMWDLTRAVPALLQPGNRVRFVARTGRPARRVPARPSARTAPGLRVTDTAFPLLVQDLGRPGHTGQGVAGSGAMDRGALRRANLRVGNPQGAAALEITMGPTRFVAELPLTLALEGAAHRAWIEAGHKTVPLDVDRPFALDPGEALVIAAPVRGVRSYLAVRGGLAVRPVLGSGATDTLAHLGPPALGPGDGLPVAQAPAEAADPFPAPPLDLPAPGGLVTLPVTLGPRADWFSPEMVAHFLAQEWKVTAQSSRVGLRLFGEMPLSTIDRRELLSEGTMKGAVQVPHSGQPILFLADHPLTGGYPVIATLHPEALDLAGQVPPGCRLRFSAAAPFNPVAPEVP